MSKSRFLRLRYLVLLIVLLVLVTGVYSFAAANDVPESGAGDGSDTISGYTVSNVTYDTNTDSNPGTIDKVTFDLAATTAAGPATEVFVKLVSGSTTWFSCTAGVSPSWSCSITGVNTLDANELRVVAAQ